MFDNSGDSNLLPDGFVSFSSDDGELVMILSAVTKAMLETIFTTADNLLGAISS